MLYETFLIVDEDRISIAYHRKVCRTEREKVELGEKNLSDEKRKKWK